RGHQQRIANRLESYAKNIHGMPGVAMFEKEEDVHDAVELRTWKRLEGKCNTISEIGDDWVIEENDKDEVVISPPWVHPYAEQYLFLNIPKIIMVSATIVPKATSLLGIPDTQMTFKEYPSTFPAERRPIYWVPTVKLSYGADKETLKTWQ